MFSNGTNSSLTAGVLRNAPTETAETNRRVVQHMRWHHSLKNESGEVIQ